MLITAAAVTRLYSMKYMLVKLISSLVTTFIWVLLITTIGFITLQRWVVQAVVMSGLRAEICTVRCEHPPDTRRAE